MIRTELFKLRTHRTPRVLLGVLAAALIVAPVYFAIRPPSDDQSAIDALTGVFGGVTPLLAAVFGGWVVGHEFRQGTLRRVLGNDARRARLIATKASLGLGALAVGLLVAAAVGAVASVLSAASFGGTLPWDGVLRDLLASSFLAGFTFALAFGLSVLLRSDTYAMLGALGVMVIVGPLLSLIPTVGKYTPSSLAADVMSWIDGADELTVSIVPASLVLATTFAALATVATLTFERSDV